MTTKKRKSTRPQVEVITFTSVTLENFEAVAIPNVTKEIDAKPGKALGRMVLNPPREWCQELLNGMLAGPGVSKHNYWLIRVPIKAGG